MAPVCCQCEKPCEVGAILNLTGDCWWCPPCWATLQEARRIAEAEAAKWAAADAAACAAVDQTVASILDQAIDGPWIRQRETWAAAFAPFMGERAGREAFNRYVQRAHSLPPDDPPCFSGGRGEITLGPPGPKVSILTCCGVCGGSYHHTFWVPPTWTARDIIYSDARYDSE